MEYEVWRRGFNREVKKMGHYIPFLSKDVKGLYSAGYKPEVAARVYVEENRAAKVVFAYAVEGIDDYVSAGLVCKECSVKYTVTHMVDVGHGFNCDGCGKRVS